MRWARCKGTCPISRRVHCLGSILFAASDTTGVLLNWRTPGLSGLPKPNLEGKKVKYCMFGRKRTVDFACCFCWQHVESCIDFVYFIYISQQGTTDSAKPSWLSILPMTLSPLVHQQRPNSVRRTEGRPVTNLTKCVMSDAMVNGHGGSKKLCLFSAWTTAGQARCQVMVSAAVPFCLSNARRYVQQMKHDATQFSCFVNEDGSR